MAFTEVENSNIEGSGTLEPLGLPARWASLADYQCPRCSYELEEFAHVERFTCYQCGLKVPSATVEKVRNAVKFSVYSGPVLGRGYRVGIIEFKDETPF